ncbi:uncharacterized protein LOC129277499 [Lytechinus pictus]|uniref:uncharacterized protein LOC129277499 n=1 Tax=Lytechinus pictus TaxID=7653 RepID=UPI0030B9F211
MSLMKCISVICIVGILSNECLGEECAALPDGEVAQITNFISVDNSVNESTICMMQYQVPDGANLWQGMLAANQQQGDNFTFEASLNPMYGHFITTINGVAGNADYFWAIFDGEGIATPTGVDGIELEDGDSYIFNYMSTATSNSSDHTIANYTGLCLSAPNIPANVPLMLLSTFITISDENTEDVSEGTNFKPVCNQLVLYDQPQSTLYDVMQMVNDQVPLDIRVVLDSSTMSVMTLNNLTNEDGYEWTPFNVRTNMTLPRDLSMIQLSDGDQIRFYFAEVGGDQSGVDDNNDGSSGVKTTMSVILFLSSIFLSFYM